MKYICSTVITLKILFRFVNHANKTYRRCLKIHLICGVGFVWHFFLFFCTTSLLLRPKVCKWGRILCSWFLSLRGTAESSPLPTFSVFLHFSTQAETYLQHHWKEYAETRWSSGWNETNIQRSPSYSFAYGFLFHGRYFEITVDMFIPKAFRTY